ncbi:MAG: VWA domain-containing protein, partial [Candidatus Thorarchaeota archaeon]
SIYWGRVIVEQEAIETYEEEVEAGHTAVLVTRSYGGYSLRFNVANGTFASLQVFIEGLLTRRTGLYHIDIPLAPSEGMLADFDVDVTVTSQYGGISGYAVAGLESVIITDISAGIRIQYSGTSVSIPLSLSLTYALSRQEGGSQLLTYYNGTQNFFAYLLAPQISTSSEVCPREYVFVLDRSGSMSGTKISQAKEAFCSMIDDMNENDIFNVVAFSTEVSTLWLEPYAASDLNKWFAKNWVNGLSADGSTNFYGAGVTGLETFTDGSYTKAMLILSDGLPTCGESTSSDAILSAIQETNSKGVSISTISFGTDADETLMANVASQNSGFFELIHPDDDAVTKLLDFYKIWSKPVASGYTIYVDGALDYSSMQPTGGAPFFNGSEVVISGRYLSSISISTTVDYLSGSETYSNSAGLAGSENSHVERIWAQQRISWLLLQVRLEGNTNELREQISALGVQYGLVVEGYTGMILVTEVLSEAEEQTGELATYFDAPATYATATPYPPVYTDAAPAADMLLGVVLAVPIVAVGGVGVFIYLFRHVKRKTE